MRSRWARFWIASVGLILGAVWLPAPALARGHFDPTTEFEQHDWIPIHIGGLDLSITKAGAYLLIGTAPTIILRIVLIPAKLALPPDPRQTSAEALHEISQTHSARPGSPPRATG